MYELIYSKNGSLPICCFEDDISFLTLDKTSIRRKIVPRLREDRDYIFLKKKKSNTVVGAICYSMSNKCIEIGYVSVSYKHQNKGIAKNMLESLFEYACVNRFFIQNSRYEKDGLKYLKDLNCALSLRYGVVFLEKERLSCI